MDNCNPLCLCVKCTFFVHDGFKYSAAHSVFVSADCSDWNVLWRLPSLLLWRRRRPRDHSGGRLHLCVWNPRALQTRTDPFQAKRYSLLFILKHSSSEIPDWIQVIFGKCSLFLFVSGSPHVNLNQNNLKYGTDITRMSTQIQEPTTPPPSPNKNSGQAEKIVLLVCNRACAGQQGRRYHRTERLQESQSPKMFPSILLPFFAILSDLGTRLFSIWSARWHGIHSRKRSLRKWSIFYGLELLCRFFIYSKTPDFL